MLGAGGLELERLGHRRGLRDPAALRLHARGAGGLPIEFDAVPGAITQCAAVGLPVEPKVLALVRERFLWRCLYLERIEGLLGGVRRGPVGPPGPLALAALRRYRPFAPSKRSTTPSRPFSSGAPAAAWAATSLAYPPCLVCMENHS
jgi:hypothetical protein